MTKDELHRRPGIRAIIHQLRIAHSSWSKERIYTEAKQRWTERYLNEKPPTNPRS
jgi:hypothetical protein